METSTGLPEVTRKTWVEASVSQNPLMVEASVSQHKVEASVSLTLPGVKALVSPSAVTTLSISVKKDKSNVKSGGYAPQMISNKSGNDGYQNLNQTNSQQPLKPLEKDIMLSQAGAQNFIRRNKSVRMNIKIHIRQS